MSFARDRAGKRVTRRGAGGLATALRGLLSRHDVTWIASAISDEDRVVARETGDQPLDETITGGGSLRLRLVEHDPVAYERYYNVVANPLLWFTQHYLFDLGMTPAHGPSLAAAWDDGYVRVNQSFADAVVVELDRSP
ncbi:MAG: trehalose-6-phosphate synthase, partial [Gaiellales bacterium]